MRAIVVGLAIAGAFTSKGERLAVGCGGEVAGEDWGENGCEVRKNVEWFFGGRIGPNLIAKWRQVFQQDGQLVDIEAVRNADNDLISRNIGRQTHHNCAIVVAPRHGVGLSGSGARTKISNAITSA